MRREEACFDKIKIQKQTKKGVESYSQAYHELMPFKIRDILLVSSLYDAFIIEEEGLISELVTGQYHHHLLSSPPQITRVTTGGEAFTRLEKTPSDLVITMSKNIGMDPYDFGKKIKKMYPDLPIILLAIDAADVNVAQQNESVEGIDKVFFWTGDSTLFLAIIKYVEDNINARYDTINGNIQILLMVEDSIRFYSMFLPIIYTEIVQQTRRSLSEDLNEMQRLIRRRARPKILLAQNYEEGMSLFEKYKDYVLGLIADVNFKREGSIDPDAGYKFVQQVRKKSKYVRVLVQSSKPDNKIKADEIGAYFLNKNSPSLLEDFKHFLLQHLGFGDFIFLLPINKVKKGNAKKTTAESIHVQTKIIARASNMKEFEHALQKIPLKSIQFHSDRNDFSNWLMARCEFKLAMKLRPKKASDFTNLQEVRKYLVDMFNESRKDKQQSIITDFSQQNFEFDSSFTRIRGDSLGGKGRGIAFMRSLIYRTNIQKKYPNICITIPSTVVIGTLEFDRFISENNLRKFMNGEDFTDSEIAEAFLNGKINSELNSDLTKLLMHFNKPIAVRSSSLLEDSQSRPFAGIYSTYMLPNNHKNDSIRLGQLCQAIKLIYASVFFKEPRAYIKSTSSKIEEEKMSIVIQELVGQDYGGRFYPTLSGTAQSLNFYPVGHQKFDEGIASIAVGLGKTVVGGEKCLRFSPKHPENIPELSSPKLIFENAQRELYVLNTNIKNFRLSEKEDVTLKRIHVEDIKDDGTLTHISSTYDRNDGRILDNLSETGPNLITFASVLKYDAFPLSSILNDVLEIGKKGLGCPVQIEFAADLTEDERHQPTFAILQTRPLVPSYEQTAISWDESIEREKIFIHSDKAMGNGTIKTIKHIIYVSPKNFDSTKTLDIAKEIGKLNDELKLSSYILIGPGRWGSEDRFLGVPVKWNQISNVRIMVETALENFIIEPSQGTHFFHNITSRGIGYINVPYNSKENFIDWNWLECQKPKKELKFVKLIKLKEPLNVKLNGRIGKALVLKRN